MRERIENLTQQFVPISLAALNERAALQTRAENKYFVPWTRFVEFAAQLNMSHAALEIKGQRSFLYDTHYFDTPNLDSYWDHMQGRRKRFKCRSRIYVDSNLCVFEIKMKGGRGETIKHRIIYNEAQNKEVNQNALAFLQEHLASAYEMNAPVSLVPMLRTYYYRVTLASLHTTERMTCDFNVTLGDGESWYGRMDESYALVEVKSDNGRSSSDQLLWRMGIRPTGSSKYCLGMHMMRPELHINRFSKLRREHFLPSDAPQVERISAGHLAALPASTGFSSLTGLSGATAVLLE